MASENTIYFYPGQGGHSHDGENSSFIDTSKYSLFDFSWGYLGDPSRIASQTMNYNSFQNFIVETVNNAVLKPAGLILQPGTVNGDSDIISNSISTKLIAANAITANEILAGTITADELAANIVLVNNVIASSNYVTGVSGWAIDGDGTAEFANTSIRGTIQADSLTTPGIDIDSAGNLTANNFSLYANGMMYASGGNFQVSAAGVLYADGASITGTIEASSLVTPGLVIEANGDLTSGGGATVLFADGSIVTSSGNFSVDTGGNLYAENADIAGTINATSGSIAGWVIGADTISASGGEIALYQEPGYGAVIAGTGAGTQIILNSEAQLHAEFGGVDTDINFQTDSAYVFRVTDGSQIVRISPLLISASGGGSFSYLANDGIYTTDEVGMNTGSVNGIGIAYPGCTTGPGTFNYMGLVWDNPNIRGTVDNAVSAVLGTVSDIRSKVNIIDAPSDWALKTLNDLRVVEYNPIDILNPDDKTEKPKRLGLIAQELADVFPELVTSVNADDPDAILSVDYLGLVPHLIQVIKLLNDKIESIEQQIGE
ncbi:Intramolecular chaperone auto-processing domain containing protein [uncultured Caudovirales phage]|uniref:Intramolecular chaperone auto-processing domain containing protein n=1 Tax=uncultured Caudovirales phage TaxID=2100421 RepID=A0A6J7XKJ3_9CAUD|nr:Intramolecular chaperone auto-processing domain containing protein [uncultured Caudovirales phage]CAB4146055.1 Intramolecular chaperone auto-processing domain containing protein [uncultured Caudovirales phage]CAB4150980.1 Intramolecular chaperone auto-processing domain containing protein [uncultured Caudovirales phage]CAB4160914.1 Intramolecular chaperone auto-processing domain containing protein [uncultured Caudovirales phage]CAB4175309.1 Intramolecular chaperone auto-processing domain cont